MPEYKKPDGGIKNKVSKAGNPYMGGGIRTELLKRWIEQNPDEEWLNFRVFKNKYKKEGETGNDYNLYLDEPYDPKRQDDSSVPF